MILHPHVFKLRAHVQNWDCPYLSYFENGTFWNSIIQSQHKLLHHWAYAQVLSDSWKEIKPWEQQSEKTDNIWEKKKRKWNILEISCLPLSSWAPTSVRYLLRKRLTIFFFFGPFCRNGNCSNIKIKADQISQVAGWTKPSAAKWNKCNAVGNMVPIDLLDAGLLQTLNLKNKKHNTAKQDRSMHVFWPFAHFKIKFLSIFFLLSCMHFLYILDMNPAADI